MVDLVALVRGDTGDSVEKMMLEEQKRKTTEEMEAERQWMEQERRRLAQLEAGREQRLAESQANISRQIAEESDAFLPSVGRGLQTVGRGVRSGWASLTGDEEAKQRIIDEAAQEAKLFEPLEEAAPITTTAGEVVGESLPFLAAGPFMPGAAAGVIPRVAAATGLGAAEGATIQAGQGKAALPGAGVGGLAGGVAELVLPKLMRVGGSLVRKATGKAPRRPPIDADGRISDELSDAMSALGVQREDLERYASMMPDAEEGEELLRAGLFSDLNIPTTRSRITQSGKDFATERMLERPTAKEGEAFRELLMDESEAFRRQAEAQVKSLGTPEKAGETILSALNARRQGMKDTASKLYDEAAALNQGRGLPMSGEQVFKGISESPEVFSSWKALNPSERRAIDDILIEYGLNDNAEDIARWAKKQERNGGLIGLDTSPKPLNTATFNDMLRDLNARLDPQNPNLNRVIGGIKAGINREIDELDNLVTKDPDKLGLVGLQARDSIEAIRRANRYYKNMKEIWDEKELVGALTAKRRGSFDKPAFEASAVFDKLKGKMASPEQTKRLVRELMRAGDAGEEALGNLQGAAILEFMENSLNQSAKLGQRGGENVLAWSGVNFKKQMDKFGRDKLEMIFANNPQALDKLKMLERAGDLKTFTAGAAKSPGTSDDIFNTMRGLLNDVPGIGMYMRNSPAGQAFNTASKAGSKKMSERAQKKASQKAMEASPVLKQQAQFMGLTVPKLYSLIQTGTIPLGASSATAMLGESDG